MRLVFGLIKGIIIGGLIGFGAFQAGLGGGFNWITACAVGAVVGLLVGRPIWSHLLDKNSTSVTSIIKAFVGAGLGALLYLLIRQLPSSLSFELLGDGEQHVSRLQPIFGAAIGGLYGAFVEVDDAPKKAESAPAKKQG